MSTYLHTRESDLAAHVAWIGLEALEGRLLLSAAIDLEAWDALAGGQGRKVGQAAEYAYEARTHYVTADTAGSHVTTPGVSAFGVNVDGVADLIVTRSDGTFRLTGSLLSTGRHILTAAHGVTDDFGNMNTSSIRATWELSSGDVSVTVGGAAVYVHPQWTGDFLGTGYDLAIIELPDAVGGVPGYDIYRGSAEVGFQTVKVGYGMAGQGDTGATLASGTKRAVLNSYDDDATDFAAVGAVNGTMQLAYDFDNGLAANDAFGFFFNKYDSGLGSDEGCSAPGDSGGPTFVFADGTYQIAGVTSYGISLTRSVGKPSTRTSDVDKYLNSSFGEFGVDTRVSSLQSFIDMVLTPDTVAPAAPTGLTATPGNARVTLDWADNAEADLAGYNVYRSTTPGGAYAKINGSLISASAFTDTGVTNGATYYYVVTAADLSANESSFSNEASATPVQTAFTMHVADLDIVEKLRGKSRQIQVTVTVVDSDGVPVGGATVTGNWSGALSGIASGLTGLDGTVTFSTGKLALGGSVTFTVANVTHASLSYDPLANSDPDGDSDGTTITLGGPASANPLAGDLLSLASMLKKMTRLGR